jgi:hypothetical protein
VAWQMASWTTRQNTEKVRANTTSINQSQGESM